MPLDRKEVLWKVLGSWLCSLLGILGLLGMLPGLTVSQEKYELRLVMTHLRVYRALACRCVWTMVTDCRLEA